MTTRRRWRRIGLWTLVAGGLGVSIWVGMYGEWTMLAGFAAWPIVGAIILSEQPRNGVGWYLMGLAGYAVLMAPGFVPVLMRDLPVWVELFSWAIAGSFWLLVPLIALVFPSGRLQSRLARATVWVYAIDVLMSTFLALFDPAVLQGEMSTGRANPLAVPAMAQIAHLWSTTVQYPAFIAVFLLALLELVLRWRRADATERLQYRWFVLGVGGMVTVVVTMLTLGRVFPSITVDLFWQAVPTLALNLPALAIGVAITRHGLYSIGRVISRTVTYAVVLLVLVGIYAGIVIGVGTLMPADNPLPVALATVAAAAAFLPLLRGVQHRIDRRFDRARYDAERVVDTFSTRLQTGIDPEATVPDLTAAVDQALRPAALGVWRRT